MFGQVKTTEIGKKLYKHLEENFLVFCTFIPNPLKIPGFESIF